MARDRYIDHHAGASRWRCKLDYIQNLMKPFAHAGRSTLGLQLCSQPLYVSSQRGQHRSRPCPTDGVHSTTIQTRVGSGLERTFAGIIACNAFLRALLGLPGHCPLDPTANRKLAFCV